MEWMAWLGVNPNAGLIGLAFGSFLSATVLPGGSELLLYAYLNAHPSEALAAVALSTLGNTLGGMSTWWAGRLIPVGRTQEHIPHLASVQRWGSPLLLLSWLPLVGDAFCLAAGWLRLRWLPCLIFMGLGKLARYCLIAATI